MKFRWHKKRELLKNPTKIEEIQEKKIINRNLTITTCLLRESNPNYQCLKISPVDGVLLHVCILSLPLRISKVPVLLCHSVCCMVCRMRRSRILQTMQHTQGDKKERELLKCVVAVKECIRGGVRHLQDLFSNTDNLDYCLLKGKL